MNTPILETDRLILRPFKESDAADVFDCWEKDIPYECNDGAIIREGVQCRLIIDK